MPRKSRYTVFPGQRFGRLIVLKESLQTSKGRFILVQCDCGTIKEVGLANLHHIVSCGCFKRENTSRVHTTHGFSIRGHPEHYLYGLWTGIKRRCYCKSDTENYANYGGRGINMCDVWKDNFLEFREYVLKTIGHRPDKAHSLDRIDNSGNYAPGNIRWLTKKQQNRNRRSNVKLRWGSGAITLADFCEHFNLDYRAVWKYLNHPESIKRIQWYPPSPPPPLSQPLPDE